MNRTELNPDSHGTRIETNRSNEGSFPSLAEIQYTVRVYDYDDGRISRDSWGVRHPDTKQNERIMRHDTIYEYLSRDFVSDGPIAVKFGKSMQHHMALRMKRLKLKPEIEFQYDGRLFPSAQN